MEEDRVEQLSRPELVAAVRQLQEELACEMLRAELELSGLAEAQTELEASLHRYADLFDHAPVGYLSLKVDGHIVHANLTAAALLGKDRQRLLGHTLLLLIAREDRRVMLKYLMALRRAPPGVAAAQEVRLNAPGPEVRVVQFTSIYIRKETGADRIRMAILDVSAQRQAEEHLRMSDNRFRTMANSAPALIWISDAEQGCIWFNRPWLEFVGRTLEQECGTGWVDNVHPEDRDACLQIYRQAFQERREFRTEYRLRRYDGAWRWVLDHAVPLLGSDNDFAGFVGSCVDITEHREAQVALQASQAELQLVANTTPVMLTRCTSELRYKFVNHAYADCLGLTPEDIIGKPIREVLGEEAFHVILPYIQAVLEGRPVEYELEIPYPHAGKRFAHVAYMPDQDPQGRVLGWVAAITDITQRKQEERRMQVRNAVDRALAEAATTSDAALTILEALCEFSGWDAGGLWQVGEGGQQIGCVEFWHSPPTPLPDFERDTRGQQLAPGSGLVGAVWKSGQAKYVTDLAVERSFLRRRTARKNGLSSVLGFPIKQGKRVLGVLEFYGLRVREPQPAFLDLLAGVGDKLGHFIERKQTEAALRESEERMRHILQTSLDAVVAFEADNTITGWNPQAELVFGWTAAEAIGRRLVDTLIPPRYRQAHLEGLQHYLEVGRGAMVEKRFEMTALHSSGREFPVELAVMPLVLEDRVSFGAFLRDISERKAGELALQRHVDELGCANLDLDRFNRAAVGRELRMIELKREVNELRLRAGLPPRYDLDFAHQPAAETPEQPAAETASP